jgi:Family of unknown function (DUF6368)
VDATAASAIDSLLRRTVHKTQRLGVSGQGLGYGERWEFIPNVDRHGSPEGCLCSLMVVPFGMEAGGSHVDTALIEEARAKLPFLPKMTLQLDNFCRNDASGHRVLARVAADLAEHFGGLIDVDGADYVLPAIQSMERNKPDEGDSGHARAVYSLQYNIDETRTGTTYCIDANLMRVWSDHPAFWLMV